MVTKVEAPMQVVKHALQLALQSEQRAARTSRPNFEPLHAQAIKEYQHAINTLTETK